MDVCLWLECSCWELLMGGWCLRVCSCGGRMCFLLSGLSRLLMFWCCL